VTDDLIGSPYGEGMNLEEKRRIIVLIGGLYADGYADGMAATAGALDLEGSLEDAGSLFPQALHHRMGIIEQSLDSYAGLIRQKILTLREEKLTPEQIKVKLYDYARTLADQKADLITHTEYATGQNEGARAVLDDSDWDYEISFPHMDLGRPGHEECDVCADIRERGPYTKEQAEDAGYPDLPHLNCDNAWVITPKGQRTRTEAHPPQ
jgi:hypothetical protein